MEFSEKKGIGETFLYHLMHPLQAPISPPGGGGCRRGKARIKNEASEDASRGSET
jgi:hypothetical protein